MNRMEFESKYPNVVFSVGKDVENNPAITPDMQERARENIREIFDRLPEHQRVILNQLGTRIELTDGENASTTEEKNEMQKVYGRAADTFLPQAIQLDAEGFSKFAHHPTAAPHDDMQRFYEMVLNEEATHAVTQRLVHNKEWLNAVNRDTSNPELGKLLRLSRDYFTTGIDVKEKDHKLALYYYRARGGAGVLESEMATEIVHFRNFLKAAKKYGGRNMFSHMETEEAVNAYHAQLKDVPDKNLDKAIDGIITRALPNAYPMFQDYEQRLSRLAEGIKTRPEAYPVRSKASSLDHLKSLIGRKEDRWNDEFKDLGKVFRSR